MKRLKLAAVGLLALLMALPVSAQSTGVVAGDSLPATCTYSASQSRLFYKRGDGLYACSASNTWTRVATSIISNAFFAVTGPATSIKTFTFPNASATVLTDNAAVTVAQGGTGAAPASDDQVLVSSSSSAASWKSVPDCSSANHAVSYDASTNAWGCTAVTGGGGGGVGTVTNNGSLNGALALGDGTADVTAYAGSTCASGYVTTIAASGAVTCTGGWLEVVKASTESVASNTTPQADDELFFTMAAGGYYVFDLYIAYDSPAGGGTPDFKYNLDCPATCTMEFTGYNIISTADTQSAVSSVVNNGVNATAGTATGARVYEARGWATSSAGGSGSSGFLLSWSQNTSGVNATRVLAGSALRYRRLF